MTVDGEALRAEGLRWIESSGGPFVVLASAALPIWRGSRAGDYEAACEVEDYLGVIRVGAPGREESVLVVADEPLPTTYLADLTCILQWQYAPSRRAIVAAAERSIEGPLEWHKGPSLGISGRMVMFDATAAGESLEADEMLEFSMPPGTYQCSTADFSNGSDIAGRLHRFRKVGSA